ncbi:MAG: hypothetical protein CML67_14890 [Rhodobacteraceae bacterium]|nr:hypothetical protein [Paracoccaceae bacterium]
MQRIGIAAVVEKRLHAGNAEQAGEIQLEEEASGVEPASAEVVLPSDLGGRQAVEHQQQREHRRNQPPDDARHEAVDQEGREEGDADEEAEAGVAQDDHRGGGGKQQLATGHVLAKQRPHAQKRAEVAHRHRLQEHRRHPVNAEKREEIPPFRANSADEEVRAFGEIVAGIDGAAGDVIVVDVDVGEEEVEQEILEQAHGDDDPRAGKHQLVDRADVTHAAA